MPVNRQLYTNSGFHELQICQHANRDIIEDLLEPSEQLTANQERIYQHPMKAQRDFPRIPGTISNGFRYHSAERMITGSRPILQTTTLKGRYSNTAIVTKRSSIKNSFDGIVAASGGCLMPASSKENTDKNIDGNKTHSSDRPKTILNIKNQKPWNPYSSSYFTDRRYNNKKSW